MAAYPFWPLRAGGFEPGKAKEAFEKRLRGLMEDIHREHGDTRYIKTGIAGNAINVIHDMIRRKRKTGDRELLAYASTLSPQERMDLTTLVANCRSELRMLEPPAKR